MRSLIKLFTWWQTYYMVTANSTKHWCCHKDVEDPHLKNYVKNAISVPLNNEMAVFLLKQEFDIYKDIPKMPKYLVFCILAQWYHSFMSTWEMRDANENFAEFLIIGFLGTK